MLCVNNALKENTVHSSLTYYVHALVYKADDGGVSVAQADSNSQAITLFCKDPV
jgi:hypothetical protein